MNPESIERSANVLSREQFRLFSRLYTSQDWLRSKVAPLEELLELCLDIHEQSLVCSLLERFQYVREEELMQTIRGLRDRIAIAWGLIPQTTRIVALNDRSSSDSSEAMLWKLKSTFGEIEGWSDQNFVNSLAAAAKEEVRANDSVVLVDEFVGTGKQAHRLVTWFKDELLERNVQPLRLYLGVVARSSVQTHDVASLVDDFFARIVVPRGIADHFQGAEQQAATTKMLRLESELLLKQGNYKLPSLGHGNCEALYSYEGGNTPNSVFPLFWWKWLKDGRLRTTLLSRLG